MANGKKFTVGQLIELPDGERRYVHKVHDDGSYGFKPDNPETIYHLTSSLKIVNRISGDQEEASDCNCEATEILTKIGVLRYDCYHNQISTTEFLRLVSDLIRMDEANDR